MTVIKNSTLIDCTPEQAFDYLVDIRNELEWNPGAQSMEKITPGPVALGTRFVAKWKQSRQLEVECIDFDRPHHWAHRNGGPVHVTVSCRLKPENGKTRLYADFDARPKGWFLLVFPLFLLVMRKEEKANMTRLRDAVERHVANQHSAPQGSSESSD